MADKELPNYYSYQDILDIESEFSKRWNDYFLKTIQ